MTSRTKLGEVIRLEREIAADEDRRKLPYVGLDDIESGTGNFLEGFSPRPETFLASKFRFTAKHLLYGKLRPYLNKVAVPDFEGVCTTEILPIFPDGSQLNRRFLWSILMSTPFVLWATNNASGANLPRLSPELLLQYPISLPGLGDQERFAKRLDHANRIRRLYAHAVQLADRSLGTVFLSHFQDEAFPTRTVEQIAKPGRNTIRTGPFGSQLLHSDLVTQGIPVLGIDNVVNNRFTWGRLRFITPEKFAVLRRYAVLPGDVLITIMGTCGRCAIVPEEIGIAINTKHICCLTLDPTQCLPAYLHGAFLYHPFVRRQLGEATNGAIMEGLNMDVIKSLQIPIPPIAKQERYRLMTEHLARLQQTQWESLREADQLLRSLINDCVGSSSPSIEDRAVRPNLVSVP